MKKVIVILAVLISSSAFGQIRTGGLDRDFIVITTFTNGEVGDLVSFSKDQTPSVFMLRRTLARNSSRLEVDSMGINNYNSVVAKFSHIDLLNIKYDIFSSSLRKDKIATDTLVIKNGYKKFLVETHTLDDLLDNLDSRTLERIYEITKTHRLFFITEVLYHEGSYRGNNTDSINMELQARGTIKNIPFTINPKIGRGNNRKTTIDNAPSLPAAYRIQFINRKDLRRRIASVNSRFLSQGHNDYLAWGILSAGYPWKLGTSFMGRHGRTRGIGYYLDIGVDFGGKPTYYDNINGDNLDGYNKSINPLHYGAGIKFFPYNNFFLSIGYGTLGSYKMTSQSGADGRWNTDGWRQSKGIPILIGCDVITGDLRKRAQALFSFGAGGSYDTFTKEWKPMVNVKIGLVLGLN
jgi:hypothetical protein